MNNGIDTRHPDYNDQLYFWKIIDDVLSDDERRLWKYLREINPQDTGIANQLLNEAYRKAATWHGYTSHTLETMIGAIYRKWPSLNVPDELAYMETNADGGGSSIYQLSQGSSNDTTSKGKNGLYVTFPKTEGQISRADMLSGKYVATIHRIEPEQIINWETITVGSVTKLSLVVIAETSEQRKGYDIDSVERRRELLLEDGVFVENLYEKRNGGFELISTSIPLDAAGSTWDIIPFQFIGSETNDTKKQKVPLFKLAALNLKHYQNSADNEESTFFGVQNQPYINSTDINADTLEKMKELGIYFGNREMMPFPVGIAASNENLQVSKEMDRKQAAMQSLGARLVTSNTAAKTAAQIHGEREGQTSVLAMIASNISEAYTQALKWACRYMGAEDTDVSFTLNQDFINLQMDAQLIQAIMNGFQMGNIPVGDYVRFMKRVELFDDSIPVEDYIDMLSSARMVE
jgi:hypothetical protein